MSPPPAHSVSPKGDDEVVSQKTFPDRGEVPEIVGVEPQDDSSAAGHMGEKPPWGLVTGPEFPSDLSRIPFRRSTWLQGPANDIPCEGMCLFHRRPMSNQRRRIIYWKRYEALPLWMSTVSLWVR